MTIPMVEELFVTQQPTQERVKLMRRLKSIVNEIACVQLCGELLLDGSFLTDKPNPSDIDLALLVDAKLLSALTPEQRAFVDRFADFAEPEDGIDMHILAKYNLGDPEYKDEYSDEAYDWGRQFGSNRHDDYLKGYVSLIQEAYHAFL